MREESKQRHLELGGSFWIKDPWYKHTLPRVLIYVDVDGTSIKRSPQTVFVFR